MDLKIATWNIRGLGKLEKQNAIKNLVVNEKLSVCAVLETRIKGPKINKISEKVFGRWNWINNADVCARGCRILVGWNSDLVQCMVIHMSDQALLCSIEVTSTKEKLFCTFIYAENNGRCRRKLWAELITCKTVIGKNPWVIMGDMNVSLNLEDHSEGPSYMTQDMEEFNDCINAIKMEDI